MTAFMYIDFLIRVDRKNISVDMTLDLALRLFPNIHWILSLTFPMAIAYGLIISTALRDLSDPLIRKSHIRRWLILSLLACPLHFLHVNSILPEANHEAKIVRDLVIHEGDSTRLRLDRSDRELSIGQMLDSIAASRARLERIASRDMDPERKENLTDHNLAWIDKLRLEIAKKIQTPLTIPITAALALAAGLLIQHLRKNSWRLTIAGLLAKAYFMFTIRGMGQLEKHLDAEGYSPLLAWTPFTLLLLAALASSYWLLKPRPEPPAAHS